jgi:hypothetical protein
MLFGTIVRPDIAEVITALIWTTDGTVTRGRIVKGCSVSDLRIQYCCKHWTAGDDEESTRSTKCFSQDT